MRNGARGASLNRGRKTENEQQTINNKQAANSMTKIDNSGKRLVSHEELERRAQGAFPLARPAPAGRSNVTGPTSFNPGDRVRVRADCVPGHIRMPGYIRGKSGVVVSRSPAYPFPDAHAHGVAAADEPTCDVRFSSEELWPESADRAFVHVGVFHS
jgi:hypothetical protein